MLKLHVLASGSKGNAAIVENAATGAGMLIDCGICKRDFLERCDEAGLRPRPNRRRAHHPRARGPHQGVGRGVARPREIRLRTNGLRKPGRIDASSALQKVAGDCAILPLSSGQRAIKAAGLRAFPFATSHDAAASFGFRIEAPDGDALGYITDSGHRDRVPRTRPCVTCAFWRSESNPR